MAYLFWLIWVFVSVRGLSPVVASGGHSSSRCAGLSPSRPLLLRSTGSRRAGSAVVAHGPSCCAACGIFPDQGPNPCPLHWQADSQPLRHQGSPSFLILIKDPLPSLFQVHVAMRLALSNEMRAGMTRITLGWKHLKADVKSFLSLSLLLESYHMTRAD